MNEAAEAVRAIFALPLEEQRALLLPAYREVYARYGVDWEANTALMADDYEFVGRGSGQLPGLPQRVIGREGYVDAQRQLNEVIEVRRVEIDDLLPLGDDRIVIWSRFVFRAGDGDGEVSQQFLELHEYRDGLLFRQSFWFDRDEGRRDLGL